MRRQPQSQGYCWDLQIQLELLGSYFVQFGKPWQLVKCPAPPGWSGNSTCNIHALLATHHLIIVNRNQVPRLVIPWESLAAVGLKTTFYGCADCVGGLSFLIYCEKHWSTLQTAPNYFKHRKIWDMAQLLKLHLATARIDGGPGWPCWSALVP